MRSEVEGVERPSWRTGGDRRSQVDGCEALLRGPSGERAHAGEHQTRHVHDSSVGAAMSVRLVGRGRRGVASPLTGWWRWKVVVAVVVSRWCCGGLSVWSTTMGDLA